MARNGSGVYVLPPSNPVSSGTVIESTWANDTMSDIANALTQSISVDGQTVPTANLPMGGFHHINVSDPTARTQYASLGMVQDGRHQRVQITGGVDNLIGTLVGGATAYVAGALITFFAPATNTGSMTINYNGIGARSLVDQNGLPLTAGEIAAGEFVLALYTGTEFRLLTSVDAAVAADLYNLSITGQVRPPSTTYPALTIATATTVNVPAGTAWIVPPGNDTDNSTQVSWPAQTITMQFLSSSFTTFVVVDVNGVIQQISGRAVGANFRNFAILGVVEHITGVVNNVITRPSIFGDDGYRSRDAVSLLANTIINGGLVTPNSVSTLQLDVAQGTIFIPGGTANTVDSPNTFNIPPQANIQFRTLAGQNTTSGLTSTVPVGSYDANGAGTVAALPNPGDATVHRLYYLYGQYILVYGQQVYSGVENALSFIEWDRTKFKKSLYLADATLMAEVIAIRTATNLNIITQGAVVCPGGLNFSIGSPGGIAEAPIDGFPYGRKNAAWSRVLESTSPAALVDATITGTAPMLKEVVSPYPSAGTSGLTVFAAANRWYAMETVNPDDKTYFRSYNPASGALRFTTTYDLATGEWTLPGDLTFNGLGTRIRGLFDGATVADRTFFQTRTTNAPTVFGIVPNGTSLISGYQAYSNAADVNNSSLFSMAITGGVASVLDSSRSGTGAFLPMQFVTSGAQRMVISNTGAVGIGAEGISQGTLTVSGINSAADTRVNCFNNGGVTTALVASGNAEGSVRVVSNHPLGLYTNNVVRLYVGAIGDISLISSSGGSSGFLTLQNTAATVRRGIRVRDSDNCIEFLNQAVSLVSHQFLNDGSFIAAGSVTIGNVGSFQAGSIYSDINYGILFRAKRSAPANAEFQFNTAENSPLYSIGTAVHNWAFFPNADGVRNLGIPANRWATVYAATGTINTSDAREKTSVAEFTSSELKAAVEFAKELGTFQWLKSIEEKGGDARLHIGMTVQRAIAIMDSHGLDPMKYGFICYDKWEADAERPAGDRYSFRYDQLALFIARGQAQRQDDLERRIAALEGL